MIVKVQRPVAGPLSQPSTPEILVYSEGRKHIGMVAPRDLPGWLAKALKANPRVYADADWRAPGQWRFNRLVKDQDW
jgi:hypothetical protein